MANATDEKGKAVDTPTVIPGDEELRLKKQLFPEWEVLRTTWEKIDQVKEARAKASFQELPTLKARTVELRMCLYTLENHQKERVDKIQRDTKKVEEAIKSLKLARDERGDFDRAQWLVSGLPIPPLNRDMDWENDSDPDELPRLTQFDEKTLRAIEKEEKKLAILGQRFNYEYVIYGINQEFISKFCMDSNLDESEVEQWIGSTKNGPIFSLYQTTHDLKKAAKENRSFMKAEVLKAFIAEQRGKGEEFQTLRDQKRRDREYAQHLQDKFSDINDHQDIQFARNLHTQLNGNFRAENTARPEAPTRQWGRRPAAGEAVHRQYTSRAKATRPRPSTRAAPDNILSTTKYTYETPEYLCAVCYEGVCGAICSRKNLPNRNHQEKQSVQHPIPPPDAHLHQNPWSVWNEPPKPATLTIKSSSQVKPSVDALVPSIVPSYRDQNQEEWDKRLLPSINAAHNRQSGSSGYQTTTTSGDEKEDITPIVQQRTPNANLPAYSAVPVILNECTNSACGLLCACDGSAETPTVDISRNAAKSAPVVLKPVPRQNPVPAKVNQKPTPKNLVANPYSQTRRSASKDDLWCTHCRETGHLEQTCWLSNPELRPKCSHCSIRGHRSEHCWSKHPDKFAAYFVKKIASGTKN